MTDVEVQEVQANMRQLLSEVAAVQDGVRVLLSRLSESERALEAQVQRAAEFEGRLEKQRSRLEAEHDDILGVVEQLAQDNRLLGEENHSLRSGLVALTTATESPPLEDVDLIFRSRSFDDARLPGSRGQCHSQHLIIPIHPPKIAHISNIFSRTEEWPSAEGGPLLTFITTTATEREMVEQYIALTRPSLPISHEVISVMELCESLGFRKLIDVIVQDERGSIINVKKILGIYRALYVGAEEMVCIDSDAIFLRSPAELFSVAQENYQKKAFFAANSSIDITKQVVEACSNFFTAHDALRIRSMMGPNLFSWFFDAPYYPKDDLTKFLSHIQLIHGGMEQALVDLSWHTFDHVLFINYLLLRGDFRLVDITAMVGEGRISDDLLLSDITAIRDAHGYLPAWVPLSALIADAGHGRSDGVFALAFHVDRVLSPAASAHT